MANRAKNNSEIFNIIIETLDEIENNNEKVFLAEIVKIVETKLGDKCPNPKVLIILIGFVMVELGRDDYDLNALNRDLEHAGCDRLYPRSLTEYLLMFSFTRKGDKPAYTWEMYQNMLYAFNDYEEYWYLIGEEKNSTEKVSTSISDIQHFVERYPVSGDSKSKTVMLNSVLNNLNYNRDGNEDLRSFLLKLQSAFIENVVVNAALFTNLRRRTQWNFLKTVLFLCEAFENSRWKSKDYIDIENDDETDWIFVNKGDSYSKRKVNLPWLANELQCFYDGTVEPGHRKSPFYRGTVNSGDSRANEDMLRNYIQGKADFGRKFMIEWLIFINSLLIDLDQEKCYTLSQINDILDSCGWGPVTKTEGSKDFDTFIATKLFYDAQDEKNGSFKIDEFGMDSEYEIGMLTMQFLENETIFYQLSEESIEIEKLHDMVDSMFTNFFGDDSTVRRSYILKNRFLVSGKYFEGDKDKQEVVK